MIGLVTAMALVTAPMASGTVAKPIHPCPPTPVMVVGNAPTAGAAANTSSDPHLDEAMNRTPSGCPLPMIVRYQIDRKLL